jgi:hypothetical protein
MQSDADDVPALRIAFDALLPLADLPRQAAVLRTALRTLVLVEDSGRAPAFHFAPRGKRVRKNDDGAWAELRTRVRGAMAEHRTSSVALAGVIGITHSTLQRVISPSSSPPGEKVIAALEAWVDALDPADSNTRATPADNGAIPATPPGLTPEQRAALGRLRAIYDPAVLAKRIGIGADTLATAVEGELHHPAAVDKIRSYLANGAAEAG